MRLYREKVFFFCYSRTPGGGGAQRDRRDREGPDRQDEETRAAVARRSVNFEALRDVAVRASPSQTGSTLYYYSLVKFFKLFHLHVQDGKRTTNRRIFNSKSSLRWCWLLYQVPVECYERRKNDKVCFRPHVNCFFFTAIE